MNECPLLQTCLQSQDSPLRSVQLQILRLLGSLGGSVNVGLLETSAQELSNVALAWDSQPRLNFPVPFVDMKPEIQLGEILGSTDFPVWIQA